MNNTNIIFPEKELVSLNKTLKFTPCPWLATMNNVCGAGFYYQGWGPVPFLFGRIPPEYYYVFEVSRGREN
jgi:hypothetical protein